MKRILRFIGGYKRLCVKRKDAAALVDICQHFGIVYGSTRFDDENMYISCSLGAAKRLRERCEERGIALYELSEHGVPRLFTKYRHRYGIALGIVVFAAIVFFSGRVIWDIRIDGNRKLSESDVIAQLNEGGLSVGMLRKAVDAGSIENRVMIFSDDISWISINVIGTVAEVEIRETEVSEEKEEYIASNIVAKKDGQIELFENVRGNILLRIGDFVRAGELIVSGLYDSQTQGIRYTAAKGRVLARTENDIEVNIPLIYDKKVYTGRVFSEKHLIFFGKEIKFYGNSGNLYASCDKIDVVEYLDFFSAGELPVGVRTVRYLEYTYEQTEHSAAEAEALAEYKMFCELETLLRNAELLSKHIRTELTEDAYKIKCRVECIEDIALVKEIEIADLP